jgi:UDP-N-acetylmuramyl pentapeptide phosphotransferase/UDP-N-acetylglucosamine-1-phosphate transferase
MIYLLLLPLFFLVFVGYLRIADHYDIIDKPNERSSHTEVTIRGGGVIYLVAAFTALLLHPNFWMPVLALFIIGVISFADDRMTLSSKIRIIFHLAAVSILFYSLQIFSLLPLWALSLAYIFVIGVINAYNFMDGINGITGVYSLVVLAGLQYVNYKVHPFINVDLIWLPILASLVFLFFNFRKRAKCFAGDVGSITVALWIIFLLISLIIATDNFAYILFLAVYGVDSVLTILHRLILGQNIFEPHRLHFYQILANERKISHLTISVAYGFIQLLIIGLVIFSPLNLFCLVLVSIVPLALIYLFFKRRLMVVHIPKPGL